MALPPRAAGNGALLAHAPPFCPHLFTRSQTSVNIALTQKCYTTHGTGLKHQDLARLAALQTSPAVFQTGGYFTVSFVQMVNR